MTLKNTLEVQNLIKKYDKNLALNNISFKVQEGDFFGFIGPNGAGKTTTIKSILGLLKYDGDIKIFNQTSQNSDLFNLIGYVPGEANLYENLKVRQQIEYFARYYEKIDRSYLKNLIKIFKVNLEKKIGDLSLGNKKKVSIILALMHQPKLLIFDEVSNGLDPLMQKVLFDELARLNKQGVTIFFSSHNLEEVQSYCKNVAIIREGKIVAIDNMQEILKKTGVEVILEFKGHLNPVWLKNNTNNLIKIDDNAVKFIFKKDINLLLRYLSSINVSYFRVTDIKLEDVFSEYYENGEKV